MNFATWAYRHSRSLLSLLPSSLLQERPAAFGCRAGRTFLMRQVEAILQTMQRSRLIAGALAWGSLAI